VRELPRQLTGPELEALFEGRSPLTLRLEGRDDPLGVAADVARELTDEEQVEALNAHPAIGAREGVSERSRLEQGPDADAAVETELAYLNQVYEEKFGFRFVVFVAGRSKAEIVDVLRERLARSREEELETALADLAAIARDRWQHG
jgi:2-oxo-4-hydroxy-4-carboxy--5-ureidoimidazoline (OHCU) decarboxylase